MDSNKVVNLFGASGHAKVIMDIIIASGNNVNALYDDAPHCKEIHGIPTYLASEKNIEGPLIVSIGSNRARKLVATRYNNIPFATAIHPSSIISPWVTIGNGTVVMQGTIIQSDTQIGNHCIINTGVSIDHECKIEDFVHISPHTTLCGDVHIGEGSWIGAGTTIIQGVRIGKWCTIGAGSVVLKDIPDGVTAYGNPCKIRNNKI